ncbi:MAG: ADP-ribosylation factor-like protein [Candidatus Heimdallarchaeota archaeon]
MIRGIWIFKVSSGLLLFRHTTGKINTPDDLMFTGFLTALLNFANAFFDENRVEHIVMGESKISYHIPLESEVAIILYADKNHDDHLLKKCLRFIHAAFISQFPEVENLEFDGRIDVFDEFEHSCAPIMEQYQESKLKVVLLGLDQAGKTSIVSAAVEEKPMASYRPTRAVRISEVSIGTVKLQLWDLGGQEGFRQLWWDFAIGAAGYLFIVDSADMKGINEAKNALQEAFMFLDLPYIIVANKQDLKGAKSPEYLAKLFEIPRERIFATSCVLKTGIQELLEAIVQIFFHEELIETPIRGFSLPKQFSSLYDACLLSFSAKTRDEALIALFRRTRKIIGFNHSILFLLDEDGYLRTEIVEGTDKDRILPIMEHMRFERHSGIIGKVFEGGTGMVMSDPNVDPRAVQLPGISDLIAAQIVVPVSNTDTSENIGVLHISWKEKQTISPDYKATANTIAKTVTQILSVFARLA